MQITTHENSLSPLGAQALSIYETKLKDILEPTHAGEAVAIHVDTGDYEVGKNQSTAARELLRRHVQDGRVVTLTIGPPTDAEVRLATRIISGRMTSVGKPLNEVNAL